MQLRIKMLGFWGDNAIIRDFDSGFIVTEESSRERQVQKTEFAKKRSRPHTFRCSMIDSDVFSIRNEVAVYGWTFQDQETMTEPRKKAYHDELLETFDCPNYAGFFEGPRRV